MRSRFQRAIVFALCSTLLLSCSASNHIGITTVARPDRNNNREDVWMEYYLDQLDAFDGYVAPPDYSDPDAAKKGYAEAMRSWKNHVKYARGRTTMLTITVTMLVVTGLVYLIGNASRREADPVTW